MRTTVRWSRYQLDLTRSPLILLSMPQHNAIHTLAHKHTARSVPPGQCPSQPQLQQSQNGAWASFFFFFSCPWRVHTQRQTQTQQRGWWSLDSLASVPPASALHPFSQWALPAPFYIFSHSISTSFYLFYFLSFSISSSVTLVCLYPFFSHSHFIHLSTQPSFLTKKCFCSHLFRCFSSLSPLSTQ